MNSINISAAGAASNLGLFKHNRSLSASRHSVARCSVYSSSSNMNAAIGTSNPVKGSHDNHEDHNASHKIPRVSDPVTLRTCTVDESFRRMEELVGSEEEEKNWKGIIIALVVIGAILGLIATAIVIVTPAPEKYDPGQNFTFSTLSNKEIQLRHPSFNWVRDSDFFTIYAQLQTDSTDRFVKRFVKLVNASSSKDGIILVPQEILSSKLRGLESVQASPNTNYALAKLDPETDSITTKSKYQIYETAKSRILNVEDSSAKLNYATWLGNSSELVYVMDNNIYYKANPEAEVTAVTADGSPSIVNGVADKLYKVYIFPKKESLIWPSPVSSKFVYAKLQRTKEKAYTEFDSDPIISKTDLFTSASITLHVFNKGVSKPLDLTESKGYVTAVSWMDADRVMVVWLSTSHQSEKYIICSSTTGVCSVNYEYKSKNIGLRWVGMYGTPIYDAENEVYYTLLPDPANEKKQYRHIAVIKVDKAKRRDPEVTFLTRHAWSDLEILSLDSSRLYFLSTGSNSTHQHLYSVDVRSKAVHCLTCSDYGLGTFTYVEAEFSPSNSYVFLSILGPDIPTFHVIQVASLLIGKINSKQVDKEHHDILVKTYENIYLPIIEYITVPLEGGLEASVKLMLPAIFRRNRVCKYELVVVINDLPGARIATQQFTLDYYDFLSKNQTYIIAYADVRGSGGRGEVLQQSVYSRLGRAEAYDISQVIEYLGNNSEHYKVDGNYTAVIGTNYGGFVTLHAAARKGIKCGVVSSPVTSLSPYAQWLVERYMNSSASNTELNYDCDASEQCSVPQMDSLLVIHGTDDAVVPVQNSFTLMMQLQGAVYNVRQQIYPNIGNDLESSDITSHYYQTVTNYLNECFEIRFKLDDNRVDYCANRY